MDHSEITPVWLDLLSKRVDGNKYPDVCTPTATSAYYYCFLPRL
jgi:hypothetical protein